MRNILVLFVLFGGKILALQDSVLFTKDYVFAEGIYLSFSQFRDQKPLDPSRIESTYERNNPQFLQQVLQKPAFQYKNEKDSLITVRTSSVWGYSRGGIVFVNHGKEFNRLMVIGSLCHFTAYVSTGSFQHDPYNLGVNTQPGYAQEQFMVDILMGRILPFSPIAMEFVLQRSDKLLAEWNALSKKKKKNSAFLYLRKYNQEFPLYFPGK